MGLLVIVVPTGLKKSNDKTKDILAKHSSANK